MSDYGDLEDLRARIHSLKLDLSQRIVPVIGSGMSNSVMPNVTELTELFGQAMPKGSEGKYAELIAPVLGTTLGYQNAASLLKLRSGDGAIARVIRESVLVSALSMDAAAASAQASNSVSCERLVSSSDNWRVPSGYEGLAALYKSLDGAQRGPIITTNFDPLIEVAFRRAGISVSPIAVPFDVAPAIEQLKAQSAIPVIHIHGYWTSTSTLNTAAQLTKPRPLLEALLRELMRSSVTLIVGYGGWEDSFMTNLSERVKEANLLEADILWSAFTKEADKVLENETLRSLDGRPGFALYLNIDGNALFKHSEEAHGDRSIRVAPYGYTGLPLNNPPGSYPDAEQFVEGREPLWADAIPGRWPLLESGKLLLEATEEAVIAGGGSGVIAIGPMGEGKSLALRQVALELSAKYADWRVYWREAGAPIITTQWLLNATSDSERIVICVDEADLVAYELQATRDHWTQANSGIVFLLAGHDRLWHDNARSLGTVIREVPFEGLNGDDAAAIARAWSGHGLLPDQTATLTDPVSACSEQLSGSSRALVEGHRTTLFGAVLDVRHGRDLSRRVADLVAKLSLVKVRPGDDVSLGDVFGGICLIQDTYDRYGALGRGASRAVIAAMVGLSGIFADGKILTMLGREAAITFSGDRVYSRHPAIARSVVENLRDQERIGSVARLVSQAGARLRDQGSLPWEEYRGAYLISKELHHKSEILEAAKGAVTGASGLLEPRVTLISSWRKIAPVEAYEYARRVAPTVDTYRDYGAAIRAYLNEYSLLAASQGEAQFGLGLLGKALSDGTGYTIDERRARYILVSAAKLAEQVGKQSRHFATDLYPISVELLDRIAGSVERERYLGAAAAKTVTPQVAGLSHTSLCARLAQTMSGITDASVASSSLPQSLIGSLSFTELARLCKPKHQ